MKLAIVTTSINPRPPVYAQWAEAGHLIVAGDVNSPSELYEYVKGLGGTYLSPLQQEDVIGHEMSALIGWKNIQRRNAAIMAAYRAGYEFILTVDDDNYPLPDANAFVTNHMLNLTTQGEPLSDQQRQFVYSPSGFLNTGAFCSPVFHQRGVPYGVDTAPKIIWRPEAQVVVSQAQVLGDPDCDAVERMTAAPNVIAVRSNAVVMPGTYSAFNSQATMWRRDWAPVMAVLPRIGRFDDIFASFIFARLGRTYNATYFVGEPAMRQERNEHDLTRDLEAEVWGMRRSIDFCAALDGAHIDSSMPLWQAYSELAFAVSHILPDMTNQFVSRWIDEWRKW